MQFFINLVAVDLKYVERQFVWNRLFYLGGGWRRTKARRSSSSVILRARRAAAMVLSGSKGEKRRASPALRGAVVEHMSK